MPAGLPRTAWLAIDLDRLVGNLHAIRRWLPAGVRVEPVVKADAYGHGAIPVARALTDAGAEGLCVATFDEALELRHGGISRPILVLYAIPPELAPEAARLELAITAGDMHLLERTLSVMRGRAGRRAPRSGLAIHLEVETGLGRAGVAPADVPAAARAIVGTPGTRLAGLWSHLGSPDDHERSAAQVAQFEQAAGLLRASEIGVPLRHLAASGGLLAATAEPYESVRPGLAVYGIVPDDLAVAPERHDLAGALRPVLSLHARPVRVATLAAGTGISYGSTFVAPRAMRVATLPVGYADGLARTLSNRAYALVRGMRVPLVGAVAMDAVMADVSGVPGAAVTIDDEFVLLGEQGSEQISALEVARARTTISWEVVASMARRLPRVYYAGSGPVGLRTLAEGRLWPASSSGTGISATSRSTRS